MLFEENRGQAAAGIAYLSRVAGFNLYFHRQDAVLVPSDKSGKTEPLTLRWLHANPGALPTGMDRVGARTNYMIGRNAADWHVDVVNYARVGYRGIYPGIDLVYYGNQQQLEYDLQIAAGADPAAIRLQLQGARRVRMDGKTGDLVVSTAAGELRLQKPLVYQRVHQPDGGWGRRAVAGAYVIGAHNVVSFRLGGYDRGLPLVIDPTVVYSTVVNGTVTNGASVNTQFDGMAVDSSGYVYLEGTTNTTNFPTSTGSYQTACKPNGSNQCNDFFVAKFDPTQSGAASLLYATYIGGTDSPGGVGASTDLAYFEPNDVAVDGDGDAYFAGYTTATDYPVTTNAYGVTVAYGGFVSELNASGNTLLYSTFIGTTGMQSGSGALNLGEGTMVAVNSSQVVVIGGEADGGLATSDGSTCTVAFCQLPFIAAFDTTKTGTSSQLYTMYLPFDSLSAVAVDNAGNAYVGGVLDGHMNAGTFSGVSTQSFPLNGFQTTTSNTAGDGPVLARLTSAGASYYASYVGNLKSIDEVNGISVDQSGDAYIGGITEAPLTQVNGLSAASGYSGEAAFVAEVDTAATGSSSLLYSTFLVAGDGDTPDIYSVSHNAGGQIAFSGLTGLAEDLTPVNPITQASATYPSGYAPFVGILDPSQTGDAALTFLSFVDGVRLPWVVAFDPSGNMVVGGVAQLQDAQDPFQSVAASYQTSTGASDNPPFFYRIGVLSSSTISLSASQVTFDNQALNTTSAPMTVTVGNSGSSAVTFTSIAATPPFAESDDCAPELPADSTCTISLTFTPTALGPASGTLTLTDSDATSPQTVGLGGNGISGTPQAALAPTSYAFANQMANTTSAPQTVVLSNSGTASLLISSLAITGADPADFGESDDCGKTLAANASCDISVTFTPLAAGNFTATVSVTDNASGSPQTAALSGTGIAPQAVLAPTSYAFANQTVNTTSAAEVVTLTNPGTAALTISGIALTGANASDFAETNNCGATLAADASCNISVTFTPLAAGGFTAAVSVTDNAAGSPQAAALSGTGVSALGFSVSATGSQTVAAGGTAQFQVTVSAQNGAFNSPVALTVSGVPAGAQASFNPSSVTPGATSASSVLTVTVPAGAGELISPRRPVGMPSMPPAAVVVFILLLLVLLLQPAWRRGWVRWLGPRPIRIGLAVGLCLGTGLLFAGCGGSPAVAQQQQSYTLTITATSGTMQQSTTVTLTVQ